MSKEIGCGAAAAAAVQPAPVRDSSQVYQDVSLLLPSPLGKARLSKGKASISMEKASVTIERASILVETKNKECLKALKINAKTMRNCLTKSEKYPKGY